MDRDTNPAFVTLNRTATNRVVAITIDPAKDEIRAARLMRSIASVFGAEGDFNSAQSLREFALEAGVLAQPEPVAASETSSENASE